jgi:DNA-directed RNA polymerase subunit RPC12/RpoP
MYCPHCEGIDSEVKEAGVGLQQCVTCGAPISPAQYDSAYRCEHCGSYMIFEERIEGEYEPHLILPFMISKDKAKQIIRDEFGKKLFLPSGFLKEAYLDKMEGIYVPFFMYDYFCQYDYEGTGKKIRTWRTGNTEYTETSYYRIERSMDIDFDKIPVDASILMEDKVMDLLEPFDYKALRQFQSKYMSGFLGEMKNMEADTLEPRARNKARNDAEALMKATITRYSSVKTERQDLRMNNTQTQYALLPVWSYTYQYRGKEYHFKLNGQTGKMIGGIPISLGKVIGYGATMFGGISAALLMVFHILEVM